MHTSADQGYRETLGSRIVWVLCCVQPLLHGLWVTSIRIRTLALIPAVAFSDLSLLCCVAWFYDRLLASHSLLLLLP